MNIKIESDFQFSVASIQYSASGELLISLVSNEIRGENHYQYSADLGDGNHLEMQYSPNGRLLNKEQSFTGQNVEYYYCGDYQPHAVRRTFNSNDNTITTFNWDANGNLIQINSYPHAINTGKSRYLYWNETNSLQAVVDPQYYSYYAYDNSGTRTLKMTGSVSVADVNAEFTQIQAVMDKITLYTSAYMVATNQGYTKHIYANEERICAKIGSGGFDDRHPMLICNNELQQSAQALFDNVRTSMETRDIADREECFIDGDREPVHEHLERPASRIMADIHIAPEDFLQKMHALCAPSDDAEEQFFYHSDHLGSASWITDGTGNAIQHIQYCPFGEPFVNEHASFASYSERFTFTGKEQDEETGYSYFGARYYDADLLTGWMSVDPMADKYPNMSPYNYCAWNPVKLVDPDGCEFGDYYDNKGLYLGTDGINDGKTYKLKDHYRARLENKSVNWEGLLDKKHFDILKQYSTCTNNNNQLSNSSIGGGLSMDITLCIGVGASMEFGIMRDQQRNVRPFISWSNAPSVGCEASIGFNVFAIIPTNERNLSLKDYSGNGYGLAGNLDIFSLAIGGDRYLGSINEKYNESYVITKLGVGIGIGGSLSQTTTKILEWGPIIDGISTAAQTYWK